MARNISQREARRLRRQVQELEERMRVTLSTWSHDQPGKHLFYFKMESLPYELGALNTARDLGFVIVGKINYRELHLYAVRK